MDIWHLAQLELVGYSVTQLDQGGDLMTEVHKQITALQLFNEKAEKLRQSSFMKALSAGNSAVTVRSTWKDDGTSEVKSERRGPSLEAIDAFALTFRFFIQDNERSSFRNIAAVYDAATIAQELKGRFKSGRDYVKKFLDSPNCLGISHNDVRPTNREVMDVFMYGGLAHANPEKYKRFKEWMAFPPTAHRFELCFTLIMANVVYVIMYIAGVNREAIKELELKV